ncbi:neutral/alkaline non-lysosomal ceramidase N-terminal domain-containing protein [Pseudozobellia thermophila]|uniref:Neutral/alkaline non-lysosomal ceramidase, N-terminal n=1 Tax=Pseudozobellia thermophila TaxID=192903 RepID=A0A1M6I520_9FLAO|nr:neutral/alkaline non-lysosomal ceramidase N-terminal domain-containing protein [Pseudozobellia thermophila]SHJ29538.1 Neutral/alkaline non-lysosomal ceramidase, N-terminal [Pseudozobellia thermophila]
MKTKRWHRRLIRVFIGLLAALLLLFIFATEAIDTTPYFETEYYRTTIKNIDAEVEKMSKAEGLLYSGFSKTNITPKIVSGNADAAKGEFNSVKMAGYGDGKYAKGVHDSLYAKAISLQVGNQEIVLISADMVLVPEPVVLQVAQNLKNRISRKQLFFGATHTHASIGNCMPSFVGELFAGEYDPKVVKWLSDKFTSLILRSLESKHPSQFGSGAIDMPHLIRNRIIGETGRLNSKLTLLSIVQDNGKKAAVGVFSAHATTVGPWSDRFSADYPGYFQRSLEAKGIDHALFFAGAVGSHSNKGKGKKFKKIEYIGNTLADSAARVLNRIVHDSVMDLALVAPQLQTPKLQAFYVSDNRRLSPVINRFLMPELKSIYLQGLRLNDFIWLAMPYELSGEYGLDLKNALKLEGYNSALTSFNGQYLGYIVPQKYYYYNNYEPRLMGWYGPSMGDYLMELNYRIAGTLTNSRL